MPFVPGSAQHIGDRQQQQDSFGFSDPSDPAFTAHGGFLGIVADGMGGLAHGAEASQTAVRSFLSVYHAKGPDEPVPAVLERAARQANADVHALGTDLGTTLVAAVVRDRELYWISVGDSHMYLVRRGRMTRLNAEHNFATELYRQVPLGVMTRAQVECHPEREHLTSYLGGEEIATIDAGVKPFPLQPGDIIMLCSDGVYRTLPQSEILECLADNDKGKACESIIERTIARHRPHQDNATVMAWQCLPPAVAVAVPAPAAAAPAPAQVPLPEAARRSRGGWWMIAAALVVALAALAGFGWRVLTMFRGEQ